MKGYMWVHGHHPAAMAPRGVVVMAPGNLSLTRQCWKVLHDGGDLVVIMEKLAEHVGADLTALPDFVAVIVTDNELHVAIRGDYELIVKDAQETQSITGGTVTWWTERRFVDVQWWRIMAAFPEEGLDAEVWSAVDACVPAAIVESTNDRVEREPECGRRSAGNRPGGQIETLGDSVPAASAQRYSGGVGAGGFEVGGANAELQHDQLAVVPSPEEYLAVDEMEIGHERTLGETNYFADISDDDAAEYESFSSDAPSPLGDLPGDHDGHTIYSTRMGELQVKARELAASSEDVGESGTAPTVLALLCINGHPNPTHAQSCRECSDTMSETSILIPQPQLGTLVLSNGTREELYKDIIIGREPKINKMMAGRQRTVTVPSPKKEISRNHCEIRVTGWDVRLRDLGSNNGTLLIRAGQNPVLVSETAPVMMQPGDIIDLGDGLTIWLEG
ncbi:MAG: FHA domain-containing protein [Ancrocorticia sp.]